jgi:hypothetical protein
MRHGALQPLAERRGIGSGGIGPLSDYLERLLRSVAGGKAHIVWRTTLFPHGWPWSQTRLPWGGFIGMVLVVSDGFREVG